MTSHNRKKNATDGVSFSLDLLRNSIVLTALLSTLLVANLREFQSLVDSLSVLPLLFGRIFYFLANFFFWPTRETPIVDLRSEKEKMACGVSNPPNSKPLTFGRYL